jgi:hypothetical protein
VALRPSLDAGRLECRCGKKLFGGFQTSAGIREKISGDRLFSFNYGS